jgi:peptidoglycan/LPS O-acetylase OafA/YrhL
LKLELEIVAMRIPNLMAKVLAALLLWPILAISLGIMVTTGTGYIYADFVLISFLLGGVGALCQIVYLLIDWWRAQSGRGIAIWAGALCGATTFSLSTIVVEKLLYFPQDAHQLKLLAFLTAAGAGIALLLRLLFRLLTPRAGDSGGQQRGKNTGGDVHPYVSTGLAGSAEHYID